MPAYFLDTSALVKRYHVEDGTTEMDVLLDHPQSVPIISRLGFVETLSALATKVLTKVLSFGSVFLYSATPTWPSSRPRRFIFL
jgi:hypothetical protein